MASANITRLPQLQSQKLFLTEGGIETTLVYVNHIDLPCFAAFPLLDDPKGRELLIKYYKAYINIALKHKTGIVMEAQTWRASSAWAQKLGLTTQQVMDFNRKAVEALLEVKREMQTNTTPIVISGNIGPLGDAYKDSTVDRQLARNVYLEQVKALAEAGVDMIFLSTITNVDEGIAAAEAARQFHLPIAISFTIEKDGRLLSGIGLEEAMREVDHATNSYPVYFGINCVHPTHILAVVKTMSEPVRKRIGMIRANASAKSHDELDNSSTLDRGDIPVYAADFYSLSRLLPNLKVAGGCCGTDEEHVEAIAEQLLAT